MFNSVYKCVGTQWPFIPCATIIVYFITDVLSNLRCILKYQYTYIGIDYNSTVHIAHIQAIQLMLRRLVVDISTEVHISLSNMLKERA